MLLTRYGVPDSAAGKRAGVYADADLQKLYDTLLAHSKTSLTEAYTVGVAVETRDIADVKDAMSTATQADIDWVHGNLLNGSKMHRQAFTDATNGVVTTHVEAGTRGGVNRTDRGRHERCRYGHRGRGRQRQQRRLRDERHQARGGDGDGTGDGICVTE